MLRFKIYLTGAGGLVGGALVPVLEAAGHEVAGGEFAGRALVDVCDAAAIGAAIAAARPDWVVHLAAYTAVDQAEQEMGAAARLNVGGTANVAAAAAATGARLLYMSTDYVYSGEKSEPYVETDAPGPLSAYGRSKLEGETAARAAVPAALIVRGGWLYGRKKGFVNAILAAASDPARPLRVVTDEVGCPTAAADLARGLAALIAAEATGIVHLANTGGVSRFDFARATLELAGLDPDRILPTTQAENGRLARRPRYSVLDCARFAGWTGVPPRPWPAALAESMADWRRRSAATSEPAVAPARGGNR